MKRIANRVVFLGERIGLSIMRGPVAKAVMGRLVVDFIMWPSDFWKVWFGYKSKFGDNPRLLAPKNFNEKIQWAKLFRRKPIYTKFADKLAVRDYVSKKIGSQYLTNILWSGDDIRQLKLSELPSRFVIKSNNGSGTNIIIRDTKKE
ncbi:MAG: ATP-grasp fold amidoligase family protein, partial [Opitutae bacterium]|nr:ATP-grasp fold amidoligase family protein [Opitutae bacterium]